MKSRITAAVRRFVYRGLRFVRRHPHLDRVFEKTIGIVPPVGRRLRAMISSDERLRPPLLIPLGNYGHDVEQMLLRQLRVRG